MIHNAVVILVGLLPLYIVRFSVFGIPTNLFEVGVWCVAIVSAGKTLRVNEKTRRVEEALRAIPKHILILIALFLLSAIISTAISPIPLSSIGILKGWVITPIVFGFLVYIARSKAPIGKTLGVNGKTPSVEEIGVINSLILSSLVVALFGLSQINGFNRIYSLYDVPNSLALFLVPVATLALWIGIWGSNTFYKYSALVMLIAIIFTQSLGAIIALIGTFLVAWRVFFPLYKGRKYGAFIFLTLSLVAIAVFVFSGRFAYLISPLIRPNTTNSITVRMQLWDIGIDLIKKHPILGIGLGQFEPAYQAELSGRFETYNQLPHFAQGLRGAPQAEYVFRDPHNWIISFWLNLGGLGLLAFVCLNSISIKHALLLRSKFSQPAEASAKEGGPHTIYVQAIALALISLLIFGLFDTIYWKNDLSALWWMLIFILLSHS